MKKLCLISLVSIFFVACTNAAPKTAPLDEAKKQETEKTEVKDPSATTGSTTTDQKNTSNTATSEPSSAKPGETTAFYINSVANLPDCDNTRNGFLYYIAQTKQFEACNGSAWIVVDLTGPTGEQGTAGTQGPTGEQGPAAPSSLDHYFGDLISTDKLISNGLTITRSVTKYWTAQGGTLIKTCTSDTWADQTGVSNGYYSFAHTYGDPACGDVTNRSVGCNGGYMPINGSCVAVCSADNLVACNTIDKCTSYSNMSWVGGHCVGTCSASNLIACNTIDKCQGTSGNGPGSWVSNQCVASCPTDQVKSSRGCESAVLCSATQKSVDNTCIAVNFSVQDGNLCGKYSSPIRITSGSHLVTCNTEFLDAVVIDDGAALEIDDLWSVRFSKTLYAIGTSTGGITFKASAGNPTGKWLSLYIANDHGYGTQLPFSIRGTYNFGTRLDYVTIKNPATNAAGGSVTLAGYVSHLSMPTNQTFVNLGSASGAIYIDSSTITGDLVMTQMGSTHETVVTGNTITANLTVSAMAGLIWKNTISAPTTYLYAGYPGIAVFNSMSGNFSCVASNPVLSQAYGNAVSGTISLSSCTQQSDNSSSVSTKTFAFVDDGTLGLSTTASANIPVGVTALVMTKDNWIDGATVNWDFSYMIDGSPVAISLPAGYSQSLVMALPEFYKIKLQSVSGVASLIGNLYRSITVVGPASGPSVSTPRRTTNDPSWSWASATGSAGRTFRYKLDDPNFSTGAAETTATNYTAPSSLAEGMHTIYVQEKDEIGNWSAAASSTILLEKTAPNTPAAPTGPGAYTNSANVTFNWASPGDNVGGTGIASYNVQIGTTSGGSNIFNGNVTGLSKTFTGTNGTSYYARVQAIDNAGNTSAFSASSSSVTVDTAAPNTLAAPTSPNAYTSSTSVTFSWTNPGDNDNGSGIASYNVQIGTTSGGSNIFNGNVTGLSKTFTGTNGMSYYARVQAIDGVGNTSAFSSSSSSVTVDTAAPITPTAPIGPGAYSNSANVTFNWTNPGDNVGGTGIASYNVQIGTTSGGNNIFNGNITGLSKTFAGTNGMTYYAQVQAVDNAGNTSAFSTNSSSVTVDLLAPNTPVSPTGPGAYTNSANVTFIWASPGDNVGGTGIASYNVQIGTTSGGTNIFTGNVTGLSKTFTGTNGTSYYARVQAIDNAGNTSTFSVSSSSVTVDTAAPSTPTAPTGPSAYTNSTSVTFSWTSPGDNDNGSGIGSYNVQIGTTSGGTNIFNGNVTGLSKTFTGTNGTSYYARVQAVDGVGNTSAFSSSSSSVTVDTAPPTAGNSGTIVTSGISSSTVTLTWTAASDNLSAQSSLQYQIYYSTSNNIDTLTNVLYNGTAFGALTPNITTMIVTGLSSSTWY